MSVGEDIADNIAHWLALIMASNGLSIKENTNGWHRHFLWRSRGILLGSGRTVVGLKNTAIRREYLTMPTEADIGALCSILWVWVQTGH